MDSSSTHPYWKTLNWVYAPLMEKWCVDLLSIRDSCGYWVRDLMFDLRICLWLFFDLRVCIHEWLFEYDLGSLFRSIINQVYYEYMCMCLCGSFMDDCRSIYGRLITDVTGSLIIRFDYGQVILILFWSVYDHRRYGRAFPIYLGLTTHNGDTCHRVILYCSFVPFGFMSYIRYHYYTCHFFYYDHTCLYSSRYRIKFRIMIMFLLFTL